MAADLFNFVQTLDFQNSVQLCTLEYSCVYTQLHIDDRDTAFCNVHVFSKKLYLHKSPSVLVDPELSAFETIIGSNI
jgi:hypothetical protein